MMMVPATARIRFHASRPRATDGVLTTTDPSVPFPRL